MDYDVLIESTYKWLSNRRAMVYLVFFSLVLFAAFLVRGISTVFLGNVVFSPQTLAALECVYCVSQVLVFVGAVFLFGFCLRSVGFQTVKISFLRVLDVLFLQIIRLWFLFVWGIGKRFRLIQFLSLLGAGLAVFTLSVVSSFTVVLAFLFFSAIYLCCVVYNSVRLLFSTQIFLHRGVKIREALNASWSITHQRFGELFFALCVMTVFLFFLFAIAYFVVSAIANVILLAVSFHSFFGGTALSDLELAQIVGAAVGAAVFVVGYCFSVTRLYSQITKHDVSAGRIRKILSWRVLYLKKLRRRVSSKRAFRKSARRKRK